MRSLASANPKFTGAQPLSVKSYRNSIRVLVRSPNCGVGLAASRTCHTGRFMLATASATEGYAENEEVPEYWAVYSKYFGSSTTGLISKVVAIQKDQLDYETGLGTELAAKLHAISKEQLEHVRPFETELIAKLDAVYKEQLDLLTAYQTKLAAKLREIRQEQLEDFVPLEAEVAVVQRAIENGLLEDAAFDIKFSVMKQAVSKEFDKALSSFCSKVKRSYEDFAETRSELINKLNASNDELLEYVVDMKRF